MEKKTEPLVWIYLAKLSLVQGNGNTAKTEMNGVSQVQLFHRGRLNPLAVKLSFLLHTILLFCGDQSPIVFHDSEQTGHFHGTFVTGTDKWFFYSVKFVFSHNLIYFSWQEQNSNADRENPNNPFHKLLWYHSSNGSDNWNSLQKDGIPCMDSLCWYPDVTRNKGARLEGNARLLSDFVWLHSLW